MNALEVGIAALDKLIIRGENLHFKQGGTVKQTDTFSDRPNRSQKKFFANLSNKKKRSHRQEKG